MNEIEILEAIGVKDCDVLFLKLRTMESVKRSAHLSEVLKRHHGITVIFHTGQIEEIKAVKKED